LDEGSTPAVALAKWSGNHSRGAPSPPFFVSVDVLILKGFKLFRINTYRSVDSKRVAGAFWRDAQRIAAERKRSTLYASDPISNEIL
jgi:hypothetical protein